MKRVWKALFYEKGTFSNSTMWMHIAYSTITYKIIQTSTFDWEAMIAYGAVVGGSRIAIYWIKKHYSKAKDSE